MSPTVVDTPGHHDSFSHPSGNGNGHANGLTNGDDQGHVDQRPVHATAKRGPEGGAIRVDAAGVTYEQDGIKAEFTDRGASVTRELCCLFDRDFELMSWSQARRMASTRSSRRKRSTSSLPSPRSAASGEH